MDPFKGIICNISALKCPQMTRRKDPIIKISSEYFSV